MIGGSSPLKVAVFVCSMLFGVFGAMAALVGVFASTSDWGGASDTSQPVDVVASMLGLIVSLIVPAVAWRLVCPARATIKASGAVAAATLLLSMLTLVLLGLVFRNPNLG